MSGKTRRVWASSGMEHPDEDMLLAYTRRQLMGEDWRGIYEHIAHCRQCCELCNEYRRIGVILSKGLETSGQRYPSVAHRVFERLEAPEEEQLFLQEQSEEGMWAAFTIGASYVSELWSIFVRALYPGRGRVRKTAVALSAVPAVIAFVLMSVVVMAYSIGTHGPWLASPPLIQTSHAKASVIVTKEGAEKAARPQSPALATSPSAPSATPGSQVLVPAKGPGSSSSTGAGPGTGKDPGPVSNSPQLFACTTNFDMMLNRVRFCGQNFTSGDSILLVVTVKGSAGSSTKLGLAGSDGVWQLVWQMQNCDEVLTTVYAQDTTHASEVSEQLVNITASCNGPFKKGPKTTQDQMKVWHSPKKKGTV